MSNAGMTVNVKRRDDGECQTAGWGTLPGGAKQGWYNAGLTAYPVWREDDCDDLCRIREREEVAAVIKAQPGVEQRSPGKYYSFNENTWQMFEAKTGKKGYR